MQSAYRDLIELACSQPFERLLDDLYALAPWERPQFVNQVILSGKALAQRGIHIPSDILVVRSSFGDRRPTLFCIKKYLPPALQSHWQNVNLTFDNIFEEK